MSVWWKMVLGLLMVLLPGGFVLLFAYALFRALHHGWVVAQAQGGKVHLRDVVASIHFRDVLREARTAL